jgi:hypothetical protein
VECLTTNADGPVLHYRLNEGEGDHAIDAAGSGHDGVITGGTWVQNRQRAALRLDGRGVVEAGGAEGAVWETGLSVDLWFLTDMPPRSLPAALAVKDGTFRVLLYPGQNKFLLHVPGTRGGQGVYEADVEVRRREATPGVDFRLGAPAASLTGRVVGTNEHPLADVPAGVHTLVLRAEGFPVTQREGVEVPPGGAVEGVDFTLPAGQTLRGRVRTADGQPVAAARVGVRSPGRGSQRAPTAGDGSFAVEGLPPGEYEVAAAADGLAPDARTGVTLPAEGEAEPAELVLTPGVTLTGRVTNTRGKPIPQATVRWWRQGFDVSSLGTLKKLGWCR